MLLKAYFLAKFRFDTAENESAKKLQKIYTNFAANLVVLALRVRGLPEHDVAGHDLPRQEPRAGLHRPVQRHEEGARLRWRALARFRFLLLSSVLSRFIFFARRCLMRKSFRADVENTLRKFKRNWCTTLNDQISIGV